MMREKHELSRWWKMKRKVGVYQREEEPKKTKRKRDTRKKKER